MSKIFAITAAFVLLAASWGNAGNFEVLAGAGVDRQPTLFAAGAGTVVKAEYRSSMKTTSDMDVESDNVRPEPVAATSAPHVKPKAVVAYKERGTRAMAPPPRVTPSSESRVAGADSKEETGDLESDLEKDLVITPPPSKTEEKAEKTAAPKEKKHAESKAASVEKKADKPDKKKAAPSVKTMAPADYERVASDCSKPIRKVKPVSQNPWSFPAGNYVNRPMPSGPATGPAEYAPLNIRQGAVAQEYRPMTPPYMASNPRRTIGVPDSPDRFVRDGVTIKLAPASATPGVSPYPDEDSTGSDILSTAAEIIGMPFAFISSFF